jgi:hypothetical protein
VLAFQISYLAVVWWRYGWCEVYFQNKAILALAVAFAGFWLRAVDLWVQRFIENHGFLVNYWLGGSIVVHLVGTAAAIVGALCWLRVTLPWGRRIDPFAWVAFSIVAFAVGFLPLII